MIIFLLFLRRATRDGRVSVPYPRGDFCVTAPIPVTVHGEATCLHPGYSKHSVHKLMLPAEMSTKGRGSSEKTKASDAALSHIKREPLLSCFLRYLANVKHNVHRLGERGRL